MVRLDSVSKRFPNGQIAVQALTLEIPACAGDRFLGDLTPQPFSLTLRRSPDEAGAAAGARPMAHSPTSHPPSPSRPQRNVAMHTVLTRHLRLASVRDMDWVTAHFGHR